MGWFSVLKSLLLLAGFVAKYMADNQLLNAGEAIAINKSIGKSLERIKKAQSARDSLSHNPDSVRDDPNNRDD